MSANVRGKKLGLVVPDITWHVRKGRCPRHPQRKETWQCIWKLHVPTWCLRKTGCPPRDVRGVFCQIWFCTPFYLQHLACSLPGCRFPVACTSGVSLPWHKRCYSSVSGALGKICFLCFTVPMMTVQIASWNDSNYASGGEKVAVTRLIFLLKTTQKVLTNYHSCKVRRTRISAKRCATQHFPLVVCLYWNAAGEG